jgi:glyoxylase-like metal-dependent hydrolase (beta-lactamase superfamily II)
MQLILPFVQPYPELNTIEGGEFITLGEDKYVAIHTPGHSDGHLCFYCKENGIMFSGDHLLLHITSNISVWPESNPDPLNNYLSSLKKVKTFNPKLVFPAHGPSFTNVIERINELEKHHHQRLKKALSFVRGKVTAYDICLKLFGENLSIQEKRFALGETLAHLVYLQGKHKLKCSSSNGIIYYSNYEEIC